jgi:hypothetical protein
MSFFKVHKKYRSDLTIDELQLIVNKNINQGFKLFDTRFYSGKINSSGFKIFSFSKLTIPVRIKASIIKKDNDTIIDVEYRSLLFIFFSFPFFIPCGLIPFVKTATMNGEPTSPIKIFPYFVGVAIVMTLMACLMTIFSISRERQALESILRLK